MLVDVGGQPGDEVAGAQSGRLLVGDVLEHLGDRDDVAGAGIVHVWSMTGGDTISPNRDFSANSASRYTGFMSAIAWHQCRIMGWFTGSGATVGLPDPPVGLPISAPSCSRNSALVVSSS